jgi:hypothetical protein
MSFSMASLCPLFYQFSPRERGKTGAELKSWDEYGRLFR